MLTCAIICALYQPGLKSFEVQNECVGTPRGRTGGRRPGFKTGPGWWGLSTELTATQFPVNQRGFMETGPHGSRAGHVRKEARVAPLCCLKDFFPFISAAQEGSCSLRFSSRRCWLLIPCLLLFFIFLSSLSPSFLAFSPSKTTFHVLFFLWLTLSLETGYTISVSLFITHIFPVDEKLGLLSWVRFTARHCRTNVWREQANKQAPDVTHSHWEMSIPIHKSHAIEERFYGDHNFSQALQQP